METINNFIAGVAVVGIIIAKIALWPITLIIGGWLLFKAIKNPELAKQKYEKYSNMFKGAKDSVVEVKEEIVNDVVEIHNAPVGMSDKDLQKLAMKVQTIDLNELADLIIAKQAKTSEPEVEPEDDQWELSQSYTTR